ncbi:MAG: hypothetical protein ACREXX_09595 [Gammaproteobacteria bacterium]
MALAETIYQHCLRLLEQAAREVLNFVETLEKHYARTAPPAVSESEREAARQDALAHLGGLRVHWGGKPIADRDVLYDEARG